MLSAISLRGTLLSLLSLWEGLGRVKPLHNHQGHKGSRRKTLEHRDFLRVPSCPWWLIACTWNLPAHLLPLILLIQPLLQWRKIFQDCARVHLTLPRRGF